MSPTCSLYHLPTFTSVFNRDLCCPSAHLSTRLHQSRTPSVCVETVATAAGVLANLWRSDCARERRIQSQSTCSSSYYYLKHYVQVLNSLEKKLRNVSFSRGIPRGQLRLSSRHSWMKNFSVYIQYMGTYIPSDANKHANISQWRSTSMFLYWGHVFYVMSWRHFPQ